MAKSATRDQLVMLIAAGLHEDCGGTLEECGAGELHDTDAHNVVDRLTEAGIIDVIE